MADTSDAFHKAAEHEARRAGLALLVLRATASSVFLLWDLGSSRYFGRPMLLAGLWFAWAYAGVSIVLAVAGRLWPGLRRRGWLAIPLLDMPLLFCAALLLIPMTNMPAYFASRLVSVVMLIV